MKRLFVLGTAVLLVLCAGSCRGRKAKTQEGQAGEQAAAVTDTHNARNSLDVDGLYRSQEFTKNGVTVWCGIILAGDEYERAYFPAGEEVQESLQYEAGTIEWNEAGNTITLVSALEPERYFVAEGRLIPLDKDGKQVKDPAIILIKATPQGEE